MGQLGHGNFDTLYSPQLIISLVNIIEISAGSKHSLALGLFDYHSPTTPLATYIRPALS
jgi:hypothetical protein